MKNRTGTRDGYIKSIYQPGMNLVGFSFIREQSMIK